MRSRLQVEASLHRAGTVHPWYRREAECKTPCRAEYRALRSKWVHGFGPGRMQFCSDFSYNFLGKMHGEVIS